MCIFCAAIPAAGAVGAKLNVDQKQASKINKTGAKINVPAVTGSVIGLLLIGSILYHTQTFL